MKKVINIFLMLLLSSGYYLVNAGYYNGFCRIINCNEGLFTLIMSLLFLILSFLINPLTTEEYTFKECLKNWKIIPLFAFILTWGFFALGETVFRVVYLITYWLSYLSIQVILFRVKNKDGFDLEKKIDYSIFLLSYVLWIVFMILSFVPTFLFIVLGKITF